MQRTLIAALLALTALATAHAQDGKKELVQRLLVLQQPGMEQVARNLVERPAMQMMQEVATVVQRQVPPDRREAVGKQIETEVRKYVDESLPIVRERAVKLAPTTVGPLLEERFTEDELKQLIAWYESPVNKKYQQLGAEMQNAFVQKLVAEARPAIDPKIQALGTRLQAVLGTAPPGAAPAGSAPRPAASAAAARAATPAAPKASAK